MESVGIEVVWLMIYMNATVHTNSVPETKKSYYDMLERKRDCERDGVRGWKGKIKRNGIV
ncbi:hypothetical protein [Bacillus paranthracis]|uniref:hypothetical protein n=1 Tax=Bacillus paranthracis TaxID=2026186 RepID=UPI0005CF42B9|nr:hypothetical protein [Bacillus paranthracis]MBG9906774.1 hypothetical protein [Bacillus paranthracis]MDA1584177.1 hypothetical protein [Bacillus cereus group sp. TH230-1LC]QCU12408.1 hypothetical protein BCPR1_22660 [Bacillus paranthracis]